MAKMGISAPDAQLKKKGEKMKDKFLHIRISQEEKEELLKFLGRKNLSEYVLNLIRDDIKNDMLKFGK